MNIEVLWIDDEYLKQSSVISDAELDGINLHPVESHEEGIIAIKENRISFHAVILDAKVKLNKSDNLLSLKGLRESRDFLIKQQKLPFFIFTGQPDYLSDEQFRDSYGDFYVKGKENQKLFDDIKKAVENSDSFKIQSEFEDVFKVCKKYFDGEVWLVIFEILKGTKNMEEFINRNFYYTQLRIIVEKIFVLCNKYGLLHDKCIERGRINLTESSLFLAGSFTKHLNVHCEKAHLPVSLSLSLKNIILTCGAASHSSSTSMDKFVVDFQEYIKQINTPYLLFSFTYQICDVLIWFDNYVTINNNYDENVLLWREKMEGKITKVENEYGTFIPKEYPQQSLTIIPGLMKSSKLKLNDKLKVITQKKGSKTHIVEIDLDGKN